MAYIISITVDPIRLLGIRLLSHIAIVFNEQLHLFNWSLCAVYFIRFDNLVANVTEIVVKLLSSNFYFLFFSFLCDILAWRLRPNAGTFNHDLHFSLQILYHSPLFSWALSILRMPFELLSLKNDSESNKT